MKTFSTFKNIATRQHFMSIDTGIYCHPATFYEQRYRQYCHRQHFTSIDTGIYCHPAAFYEQRYRQYCHPATFYEHRYRQYWHPATFYQRRYRQYCHPATFYEQRYRQYKIVVDVFSSYLSREHFPSRTTGVTLSCTLHGNSEETCKLEH